MQLTECIPNLGDQLIKEIESCSSLRSYSEGDFIVKEGEPIRFLPLVLEGHVSVFSQEDHFQFLLYYISSGETCIFSFAHLIDQQTANFTAKALKDSKLLMLPLTRVQSWLDTSARFNQLLLNAYQKHYNNLLETTKQVICYNLEDRLFDYLEKRTLVEESRLLPLSHQQIADDLGTSREVISRLIKKLGHSGKVVQKGRKIEVL